MGDPALLDGLAQRGGDVFLPHQLAEVGGPPLAVVDLGGGGGAGHDRWASIMFGMFGFPRLALISFGS